MIGLKYLRPSQKSKIMLAIFLTHLMNPGYCC
nr:MAG TPA: hypothetical protein [Caudoviricetes sp.]